MPPAASRQTYRFGEFELDVAAYELRRAGRPVKLERRPMELLILLVERRSDLVSRADIVKKLWGDDVFVDVDMGVNTAIRKVRQALGDSPDVSVFVTTVSGKGYRFTADVSDAERHGAIGPGAVERMTIAVLPFENLSADLNQEYLADGLTEEAITVLGQIDPERIAVIGRTSVTAYRRTTKTLAEIGRELGAQYLVESSIRSEGGRLRITSKLIRAADQAQVWSAAFDNEPGSLLELQRELCRVLATQIHLKLSPQWLDAIEGRQTRDAEAYQLYLQGRYFFNQLTASHDETRAGVLCARHHARSGIRARVVRHRRRVLGQPDQRRRGPGGRHAAGTSRRRSRRREQSDARRSADLGRRPALLSRLELAEGRGRVSAGDRARSEPGVRTPHARNPPWRR